MDLVDHKTVQILYMARNYLLPFLKTHVLFDFILDSFGSHVISLFL